MSGWDAGLSDFIVSLNSVSLTKNLHSFKIASDISAQEQRPHFVPIMQNYNDCQQTTQ